VIVFGQCPDTVQMIRQEYPRINGKRIVLASFEDGITQQLPCHFVVKNGLATIGDDRKKISGSGTVRPTVIGHNY